MMERFLVVIWYIVRAQLEQYAELVSMGSWDFVINMSGADLPLRQNYIMSPQREIGQLRDFFKLVFFINLSFRPPTQAELYHVTSA